MFKVWGHTSSFWALLKGFKASVSRHKVWVMELPLQDLVLSVQFTFGIGSLATFRYTQVEITPSPTHSSATGFVAYTAA